ncbi:MAG: hypothetical protein II559_08100, partial [Muribaculaceae bacterium]|nr:hypothetical protein [Muribaculaceae bacterium]
FRFAIIFTLGGGYSPPCRLAFPSVFFIILFYENNFQKTFALLIGTFISPFSPKNTLIILLLSKKVITLLTDFSASYQQHCLSFFRIDDDYIDLA